MNAFRVASLTLLWFFLALLVVGALGLPISLDLVILLLLALVSKLSIKVLYSNLVLLLVMVLLVIELPTRLIIDASTFYRPQDQFAEVPIFKEPSHQRRYLPNIKTDFQSPHGDLVAIGGAETFQDYSHLVQARTVRFETDEHGYRNTPGSAQTAELVLVGDSFVEGVGLSQESTPASQIKTLFGVNAYSLAFPDDPPGYIRRLNESEAWLRPELPKIIFLFAGNDFQFSGITESTAINQTSRLSNLLIKQLGAKGAYTRLLYQRVGLRSPALLNNIFMGLISRGGSETQRASKVVIKQWEMSQTDVVLYTPYLTNAAPTLSKNAKVQLTLTKEQRDTTSCLVLIPSKEQLYLGVNGGLGPENPLLPVVTSDASLQPSIKKIDLLPLFIASARTNPSLPLFLSDDTHWTPDAVGLTVKHLRAQGCLEVRH